VCETTALSLGEVRIVTRVCQLLDDCLQLDEGCMQFSDIHGLEQIHFPKGHITAKTEAIRDVLKREGIIK
jgi:hypothetical protein